MPRAPDGTYNLPTGVLVNSGDTILVSQHNPAMTDIATAIGNSLDRNGSGGMRAALNMGGNPIQNVANGTNPSDVATVAQASSGGVPMGCCIDFTGTVPPTGYLFPYGQAISRTTYADYFAMVGTTYGPGDGSTTFNVIDKRGVGSVGKDDMGGTASGRLSNFLATTLGAIFGSQTHTLGVGEMPAHGHGVNDPGHAHNVNAFLSSPAGAQSGASLGSGTLGAGIPTNSAPAGISIKNTGGGAGHNNVQPSVVMNVILKVSP